MSSQVRVRGAGAFPSRGSMAMHSGRGGGGRGGRGGPVRGRGSGRGTSFAAMRGGGGVRPRGGSGRGSGRPQEPLVPKKVVAPPPPPTEAEMREATKMWVDKTREASDCELLDGMLPHIREHFAVLGRPEHEYRICHIPVFAYGISVTVYSKKASVLRDLIRVCGIRNNRTTSSSGSGSSSRNSSGGGTTTTPSAEYQLPHDAKLRFNTSPISGEVWLQIEFDCHEEAEGFAKHVWVEWTLVRKGQPRPKMLILPDGLYLRDQRPAAELRSTKSEDDRHRRRRDSDEDEVAALSRRFDREVGQERESNSERKLSQSASSQPASRPSPLLESILRDRVKRQRVDDIPSTHHGCWNTGNLHRRDGGAAAGSGSSGRNDGDDDPTASDIREFTERLSSDDLLLLRKLNISVEDVVRNPLRVENFALSEMRDHRVDQSALLQLVHKSRTRLHCL